MRLIDADAIQIPNTSVDMFENCRNCNLLDADQVREIIDNAPTIEPKRGEWKRRLVDNGFNADWVCSECGYRVKTDFVDYNYCPNCGADMREREGE